MFVSFVGLKFIIKLGFVKFNFCTGLKASGWGGCGWEERRRVKQTSL
jgi:hypothetical protein